jgi:hypothetical protein
VFIHEYYKQIPFMRPFGATEGFLSICSLFSWDLDDDIMMIMTVMIMMTMIMMIIMMIMIMMTMIMMTLMMIMMFTI